MTLVLAFTEFSFANPSDTRPQNIRTKSLLDYEKPHDIDSKKQSLNPASINESDIESSFYPYQSSLTFKTGASLNFKELRKDNGDKKIPIHFGMKYMLHSENSRHQEYGVDILSSSKLYLNGGYKYIIDHTDSLRPYYKLGLAMRFDAGDYLETPFDFKSYSVVLSAGVEDLLKGSSSLRFDTDLFWGPEDFLAMFSIGWSFGF